MRYAGIGSRQTPQYILNIMGITAELLAKRGYECATGAADGADQAFAEGALRAGGVVHLHLPWQGYNKGWVSSLWGKVALHVLPSYDSEAMMSVYRYHPNPERLSQGAKKLHARNYRIVEGSAFVICWTKDGITTGGTGQAIRIAEDFGIKVYNLGNREILTAFEARIERLTGVNPRPRHIQPW